MKILAALVFSTNCPNLIKKGSIYVTLEKWKREKYLDLWPLTD
jgi:hypothetical protein